MTKLTPAILKEALSLKGGPVETWLSESLQETLERLSVAKAEEDFRVLQGEARAIKHILDVISEARAALETMSKPKVDMSKSF